MNDPVAMLKRDHREVSAMLKQLAETRPGAKRRKLGQKVADELTLHMQLEEQLIYPVVKQRVGAEPEQEAEVEHTLTREGVAKMTQLMDDPGFGAAVAMLTAGVKHHVKEEEGEVFPKLKRNVAREELGRLGDELAAAKKNGKKRR